MPVARTARTPSPHHRGAGEDQLRSLPEWHPGPVVADRRQLEHRVRLAAEGALIDPQPRRRQDLAVGRHLVALADPDDVARHELAGRQSHLTTGAKRGDRRGKHLLKRLHGALGPVLLQEAEDAVDDDHREDRPAQLGHPGQDREDPGHPEEHGEEAPELLEQTQPKRAAADALEPVRPAGQEAPAGLGGVEPRRARREQAQQLGGPERHLAGRALGRRERLDQRLAGGGRAGPGCDLRLGQARHEPPDQTEGARAVAHRRDENEGRLDRRQPSAERRTVGKVHPAERHAPGAADERVDQRHPGARRGGSPPAPRATAPAVRGRRPARRSRDRGRPDHRPGTARWPAMRRQPSRAGPTMISDPRGRAAPA
jgi:hypothetical protein